MLVLKCRIRYITKQNIYFCVKDKNYKKYFWDMSCHQFIDEDILRQTYGPKFNANQCKQTDAKGLRQIISSLNEKYRVFIKEKIDHYGDYYYVVQLKQK